MLAIFSPDMPRAAPIRQDSGRPHVLPTVNSGRTTLIMTQPAFSATLSAADQYAIERTAAAWRARGLTQVADNLLIVAGLNAPVREPSVLPPNVFRLSDYRRAVQR